ncbi:MAG: MBL fold metallo-hydrolase [Candidatus Atribacteria bacterium]|jgi:cyclase|nr:MAG: MBL fold metallo-hydrolase [Candidatus Atribacteria bacterium]
MGDLTIVVDTFMMPKPGAALCQAAEELTGRKPRLVVLTHSHQDHWGGAQSFSSAILAASANARAVMLEDASEYEEWKDDTSELEDGIKSTEAALATEQDPDQRTSLEERLARDRGILSELPTLTCRIPELTLSSMTFHGSRRIAEIRALEMGHTDSDVTIELPDDGIVICGDLAFFDTQPFMWDGAPEPWMAWLQQMEASAYETFMPGHGPVGGKAQLALLRQYIETLSGLVSDQVKQGNPVEQALELKLPEPFSTWQATEAKRFEINVRALHNHFSE